jgi:hypothetical protein
MNKINWIPTNGNPNQSDETQREDNVDSGDNQAGLVHGKSGDSRAFIKGLTPYSSSVLYEIRRNIERRLSDFKYRP